MEHIERTLTRGHFNRERLPSPVVIDDHEQPSVALAPKQPHADAMVAAAVNLAGRSQWLGRHPHRQSIVPSRSPVVGILARWHQNSPGEMTTSQRSA
jgi:hypothetical protein